MKILMTAAVAAIALSASTLSTPVQAKPAGNDGPAPTCSVSDVTAEGANALLCETFAGNDTLGKDPSGYAVNVNSIFDHDDWQFLAKDESGGSNEVGLEVTGLGELEGLWSLDAGVLSAFEEFAIVLKSSTYWAAYLFDNNLADDGTWESFTGQGLSHFTIYVRGEGGGGGIPVPEPAALSLLGLGVLGVALRRRRRS